MDTTVFNPDYLKAVSEIICTDSAAHITTIGADITTGFNDAFQALWDLSVILGRDGEAGKLLHNALKALNEAKIRYEGLSSIIDGAILKD